MFLGQSQLCKFVLTEPPNVENAIVFLANPKDQSSVLGIGFSNITSKLPDLSVQFRQSFFQTRHQSALFDIKSTSGSSQVSLLFTRRRKLDQSVQKGCCSLSQKKRALVPDTFSFAPKLRLKIDHEKTNW